MKASPYERFPPAEAKRIADALEVHYTPKKGSWLNTAEIELSALEQQCLDRRIPDTGALRHEVAIWTRHHYKHLAPVSWQFTTEDARIKLKRLYPSI